MTTAIIYASKHGLTSQLAADIADRLGPDTAVFDLGESAPPLAGFDTIVLGTPIYAGRPLAAMRSFVSRADLRGKRVALFVTGMESDPHVKAQEARDGFPADLVERAIAVAFLGGRFRFASMNPIERFLITRIKKTTQDTETIDQAAIDGFVAALTDA
ncbi:MAG: flavodoxin domain-containing protein [Propionibacteriaceae bacterium]|jgi:menaquinone-dependent protoporphyrinogen IX oxidase|nr:flavodoxin domain-containing protein [Propionibacteriaceae bacterium]